MTNTMSLFSTPEDTIDCGRKTGICTGEACPIFDEELACCETCAKKEDCPTVCPTVKKGRAKYCKRPKTCPPLDTECEYVPANPKKKEGYSQTCCAFCNYRKDCKIVCPIVVSGITGRSDEFYNSYIKISSQ